MEWILRLLGVIGIGYGIAVAALYVMQRSLMYYPSTVALDPSLAGVPGLEEVTLHTDDGLALTAWWIPRRDPAGAVIVYLHGNAGSLVERAPRAALLSAPGHGVLLVEYRGYGGNPGRPTEAGLYADGRAAFAFLDSRGIAPEEVVLYGESLGTGVAVQLATEQAVRALILEAPFTSAGDVGQAAFPFMPVNLLIRDRFDSVKKIDAIGAPLLVIHGERDRIVPVRFGRALLAAAGEPKRGAFFPDAGHEGLYLHGAGETVLEYLRELRSR